MAKMKNLNPSSDEVLLNYKLQQNQTLTSPVTRKRYNVSFKNPKVVVSKQDAEWLLGLKRNGRTLFELAEQQETINGTNALLEETKEEKVEEELKNETLSELPVETDLQESELLLDEIVALEQEQEVQKPKGKKKNVSMQSEN